MRKIQGRPKNRKEQYLKRIQEKSTRETRGNDKHWNIKVNNICPSRHTKTEMKAY